MKASVTVDWKFKNAKHTRMPFLRVISINVSVQDEKGAKLLFLRRVVSSFLTVVVIMESIKKIKDNTSGNWNGELWSGFTMKKSNGFFSPLFGSSVSGVCGAVCGVRCAVSRKYFR